MARATGTSVRATLGAVGALMCSEIAVARAGLSGIVATATTRQPSPPPTTSTITAP